MYAFIQVNLSIYIHVHMANGCICKYPKIQTMYKMFMNKRIKRTINKQKQYFNLRANNPLFITNNSNSKLTIKLLDHPSHTFTKYCLALSYLPMSAKTVNEVQGESYLSFPRTADPTVTNS